MPDYKAMYLSLFSSITDAIELLKAAQEKGEQQYIETNGQTPILTALHINRNDEKTNSEE
ncbi:MAG TPA: hypothetical protein PKE04_08490 [Clostridia bacterium]|nr:hypothetical protein [Clostridia bacterium]